MLRILGTRRNSKGLEETRRDSLAGTRSLGLALRDSQGLGHKDSLTGTRSQGLAHRDSLAGTFREAQGLAGTHRDLNHL